MVSVKDSERIPAKPLLDYLQANGGLAQLLPGVGVAGEIEIDTAPFRRAVIERTPEENRRERQMRNIVEAASKNGTVPLHSADRLCVEGFGIHPVVVWGADWYGYGDELSEADEAWVDRWVLEDSEGPQIGSVEPLAVAA